MSYINKMSKNSVSYDIQDARLEGLEASVTDLSKLKDISGSDGDVLGFNAEGNLEGKSGYLQSTQILDSSTGKILDSKIPDGFVKSVNNYYPVNGNVDLVKVNLADNLYSADNIESNDDFDFRTSGGTASIYSGDANLVYIQGHSKNPTKTEDSFVRTASSVSTPSFAINSFDGDIFKNNAAISGSGTYSFNYADGSWTLGSATVSLADFGISVSNLTSETHLLSSTPGSRGSFLADWGTNDAGLAIFRAKGLSSGTYSFRYNGNGNWYYNTTALGNTQALYSAYGINISPATGTETAVLPTATFVATQTTGSSGLTISVDINDYRECTNTDLYDGWDKTIELIYKNNNWVYMSGSVATAVTLSDVGIYIDAGTPVDNDVITMVYDTGSASVSATWVPATQDANVTVVYTAGAVGSIVNVQPSGFKAVGLNAYDVTNMTIADMTISGGAFVANSGTSVAIIPVVGGCEGSTGVAGYTATLLEPTLVEAESTPDSNQENLLTGFWFAPTKVTSGTIPDVEDLTSSVTWKDGTDGDEYGYRAHVDFGEDNGYLYLVVDNDYTSHLCVHPAWSEYMDKYYAPYSENTISFSSFKGKLNNEGSMVDLPLTTYGMPSVGTPVDAALKDELNFDRSVYIQKVARLAYSAANLATAKAYCELNGTSYAYDSNWIYYGYKKADYKEYTVYASSSATAAGIDGSYQVHDFGTEAFTFDSGVSSFSVYVETLYGQNLKDKLRTDVLTKSTMSLTSAEQTRIQTYLGVPSASYVSSAFANVNYVRVSESATSGTINIDPNTEKFIATEATGNLTINLNQPISGHSNEWRIIFYNGADDGAETPAAIDITVTLTGNIDSDTAMAFMGDDVTATTTDDVTTYTITCDASTYYELSFAHLVSNFVGVIVKAWEIAS